MESPCERGFDPPGSFQRSQKIRDLISLLIVFILFTFPSLQSRPIVVLRLHLNGIGNAAISLFEHDSYEQYINIVSFSIMVLHVALPHSHGFCGCTLIVSEFVRAIPKTMDWTLIPVVLACHLFPPHL